MSSLITVSQWPRLEVAARATPSISASTEAKPCWTPRDDAGDRLRAFAGGLGALRGVAALADQAFDLAVEIAHGVGDLMRGLARGLREVLHLACDHREAAAGSAGARRFDGGVQREQIGLLGDRLDRAGDLRHLRQRRADRGQARLDPLHRGDELGDVADRDVDGAARLRDLADRGRRRGLHRLRGIGDVVVGRDHRLGRLLQMVKPFRLARDAVGDVLDVAGDVGELDAETADAVGELVDQAFGQRPVGGSVQYGKLCRGHVRALSSRSR
ncbi:hypothetical protein ABH999_001281 [Bradyrhizobium yuanmingense]